MKAGTKPSLHAFKDAVDKWTLAFPFGKPELGQLVNDIYRYIRETQPNQTTERRLRALISRCNAGIRRER